MKLTHATVIRASVPHDGVGLREVVDVVEAEVGTWRAWGQYESPSRWWPLALLRFAFHKVWNSGSHPAVVGVIWKNKN